MATGESLALTEHHSGSIDHLEFSPDGRYLASLEPESRVSRTLTIWDLTTRALLAKLDIYGLSGARVLSRLDNHRRV